MCKFYIIQVVRTRLWSLTATKERISSWYEVVVNLILIGLRQVELQGRAYEFSVLYSIDIVTKLVEFLQ